MIRPLLRRLGLAPPGARRNGGTIALPVLGASVLAGSVLGAAAAMPQEGASGAPPAVLVVAPHATLVLEAAPELATEAAWGDAEPAPATEIEAPASGDHWLTVRSRDLAGVLSAPRRLRVRVDTTPPALSLALDPAPPADGSAAGWLPPRSRATLVATDEPAGVDTAWLELAGSARSAPAPGVAGTVTVGLPATTGTVTLLGAATDRVGNHAERRFELRIDATPPTLEVTVDGARATDAAGLVRFGPALSIALVASDQESGVASRLLLLGGRRLDSVTWSGTLEEGEHRIESVAFDRVGNRADQPRILLVDASGPVIDWHVEARASKDTDAGPVFRPPVTLLARAHDQGAGVDRVEWATDAGGPWRSLDEAQGIDVDRALLRATDRLGNQTRLEAAWRIDREPPTITAWAHGAELPAGADITLQPGDSVLLRARDATGVAGIVSAVRQRFWYRDVLFRPAERVRFSRIGTFFLLAYATDDLGNRSDRARWRVVVAEGGAR